MNNAPRTRKSNLVELAKRCKRMNTPLDILMDGLRPEYWHYIPAMVNAYDRTKVKPQYRSK